MRNFIFEYLKGWEKVTYLVGFIFLVYVGFKCIDYISYDHYYGEIVKISNRRVVDILSVEQDMIIKTNSEKMEFRNVEAYYGYTEGKMVHINKSRFNKSCKAGKMVILRNGEKFCLGTVIILIIDFIVKLVHFRKIGKKERL